MGSPGGLDDVDKSRPQAEPLEVGPVVGLDVAKSAKLSVSAHNRTPTPDVSVYLTASNADFSLSNGGGSGHDLDP